MSIMWLLPAVGMNKKNEALYRSRNGDSHSFTIPIVRTTIALVRRSPKMTKLAESTEPRPSLAVSDSKDDLEVFRVSEGTECLINPHKTNPRY